MLELDASAPTYGELVRGATETGAFGVARRLLAEGLRRTPEEDHATLRSEERRLDRTEGEA